MHQNVELNELIDRIQHEFCKIFRDDKNNTYIMLFPTLVILCVAILSYCVIDFVSLYLDMYMMYGVIHLHCVVIY